MADFIDESIDSFTVIPGLFVDLETHPENMELVEAIFRPVHSLKGNAAYFGLLKIKNLSHELESVLDLIRKNRLAPTKESIDIMLAGTDEIVSILERTRSDGSETVDEEHFEALCRKVSDLAKMDTGSPIGAIQPECRWTELADCVARLKANDLFKGTNEGNLINRIAELVTELNPNTVIQIAPVEDANILEAIRGLALEASDNEEALVQQIQELWDPLLARAEVEEAREAIEECRVEFELMAPKILMDDLVREMLIEMADKIRDMQTWGPEGGSETDDPIATLRYLIELDESAMNEAQRIRAVRDVLVSMEDLTTSAESERVLTKVREEFELFSANIGFDPMLVEALQESADVLADLQDWTVQPKIEPVKEEKVVVPVIEQKTPDKPEDAPKESKVSKTPAAQKPKPKEALRKDVKEPARTMRVSEESIDSFLGYVGELIAVDEMFRYIHSEMVRENTDLQVTSAFLRVVNTFTKLSDDLQASIMEIRKVSMKPMLQKTQRIVRDIATSHNKNIATHIEGEDVMIDRSLIDTLEAPVVHMVRNAADHGIEGPEDRLMSGKADQGNINISVREAEDEIILTIEDDGRGLNYERIREKAINLGLLEQDENVTEERLASLIFSSGFSTADKVTDVSGRGVGMDAVKRSVEDAGGNVELSSVVGQGTVFQIHLPKTVGTQILGSFVVSIDQQRFVVPMDRISGSFKARENMFHSMPDGKICVRRGEMIYPVLDLEGPVSLESRKLDDGILIVMESKIKPFAFYVDSIIGMQKVVLRNVPWFQAEKFLGAAIMGDGRVSMIINVAALEEMVI